MTYEANSVEGYIDQLPEERKEIIANIRKILQENLPEGFSEQVNYNMPSFVVSHSIYPGGYHCDPKLPLPFISYASQKNFVALYHMGIYANKELMDWFVAEYPKALQTQARHGKKLYSFQKNGRYSV